MIEINQCSTINLTKYQRLINSYMKYRVTLDVEYMAGDIEKLQKVMEKTPSKIDRKNMEAIINYIQYIANSTSNNVVDIRYTLDEHNRICSVSPFEIRKIDRYGIDFINYFKASGGIVVEADYSELVNAICFECMFRDLGYTDKEIEKNLENIDIFSIHSSKLLDFIPDDSYESSSYMRIGDSTKYDSIDKVAFNYFSKPVSAKDYKQMGISNELTALNIINYHMLRDLQGVSAKIWRLGDNVITAFVTGDAEEFISKIPEVAVRLFGRRFLFKPNINTIKIDRSEDQ